MRRVKAGNIIEYTSKKGQRIPVSFISLRKVYSIIGKKCKLNKTLHSFLHKAIVTCGYILRPIDN